MAEPDYAAIVSSADWVPATVPYSHCHDEDNIVEAIGEAHRDVPDDDLADAVVEAWRDKPSQWVRVILRSGMFLVEVEYDTIDDEDYSVRAYPVVRGRYPR